MSIVFQTNFFDENMNDHSKEMIHDAEEEHFEMYDSLKYHWEQPLYPSCTTFRRLSMISRLFNLIVRNEWTNISFSSLSELVEVDIFSQGDVLLSNSNYEAKKISCLMNMNIGRYTHALMVVYYIKKCLQH